MAYVEDKKTAAKLELKAVKIWFDNNWKKM